MFIILAVADAGLSAGAAPWANLAAVVIICCLFVWFLTKHIPEKDRRHEERADAKDLLFVNALAAERERSREAAATGHMAAQSLAGSLADMSHEIRRFNDSANRDAANRAIPNHARH